MSSSPEGEGKKVTVLGIRHHGPGSARAVERALQDLSPDCVLIEGPAELTDVIGLARSADLVPPVAGFVYLEDQPKYAVFDPFAVFSPEWVALTYGVQNSLDVRFMDLPAAHDLVARSKRDAEEAAAAAASDSETTEAGESVESERDREPFDMVEVDEPVTSEAGNEGGDSAEAAVQDGDSLAERARLDPIGTLADLVGYEDGESWWEDVIEHGQVTSDDVVASLALFETVAAAMCELRDAVSASPRQVGSKAFNDYERNEQREAAMRTTIRAALSEGRSNIAVVCGAWHAPALDLLRAPTAKADAARLKGLNKGKVVATWVPWTHQRLSAATGYGAGVRSPGWYHHVFQNSGAGPELLVGRWMVQVSRVLREEGLDASPASTIEAVRLANTLATIRNRPVAGLAEIDDAILSVLAQGTSTVFNLVRTRLSVGDQLGSVPDETPMVPLARDLATQQKKLRLKVAALEETIDLDLRKPNDLAKSHLLHRLTLLGVSWGVPAVQTARTTGSFHELWTLAWQPELAVALVEASTFGTTVEAAASAFVQERAATADLAELTKITTEILQADLQDAVPGVLSALNQRVAMVTDVGLLMDAVGPLARVARYGDVRRTDGEAVGQVVDGLLVRICAGLAGACAALDNDAATVFRERLDHVHAAVGLLDDPENRGRWNATLLRIAEQDSVHGLLAGRMVRILTDAAILEQDSTSGMLSQALSRGADPERSAHWIEGFLSGSALLLLHDKPLLTLIDQWIASVDGAVFDDLIPLLRRTFSAVSSMERRMIGNAVVGGVTTTTQRPPALVDDDRGSLVIESFLGLIGVAQ